jgi:hypothetical protein
VANAAIEASVAAIHLNALRVRHVPVIAVTPVGRAENRARAIPILVIELTIGRFFAGRVGASQAPINRFFLKQAYVRCR